MDKSNPVLQAIHDYVREQFAEDATGHDYYHMVRVVRMAKEIAKQEGGDLFVCEAAGWLHDIGDKKLFSDPGKARVDMDVFLSDLAIEKHTIQEIHLAINDVSFSKGKIPNTLEGKIVQDADRLDALGAIGIARVFAYGGSRDQLIYHEKVTNDTSVDHFYEKLLLLKNLMNTQSAKEIAKERHAFMEAYLKQFFIEWKG
ncbi:HD domain-containing protein [Virgibacillus sp. DJP39]|uniref:HD domain-containing protein n=1 Tax=Virgibacillus sp. DJP39 TaxID=3409790 RepID=UPI003BB553F7